VATTAAGGTIVVAAEGTIVVAAGGTIVVAAAVDRSRKGCVV
jgi:hypothetical protein